MLKSINLSVDVRGGTLSVGLWKNDPYFKGRKLSGLEEYKIDLKLRGEESNGASYTMDLGNKFGPATMTKTLEYLKNLGFEIEVDALDEKTKLELCEYICEAVKGGYVMLRFGDETYSKPYFQYEEKTNSTVCVEKTHMTMKALLDDAHDFAALKNAGKTL